MTVEEIRLHASSIEALRVNSGALSLRAYLHQPGTSLPEAVFVADLDMSHPHGYADRYFTVLFGLQRILAHQVELVESATFAEAEKRYGSMVPVSLDILRATA